MPGKCTSSSKSLSSTPSNNEVTTTICGPAGQCLFCKRNSDWWDPNGKDPAGHANHFHKMATELIGTGEVIDDETWSYVREELKTGWQAQAALVAGRQARIAQANDRLEHAWIEGLGQHVASIDSFAYADWERRNPGITGDKDWLHGLLRDNPECRVKSRSAKTQVSMAGLDFRPAQPSGICPDTVSSDSVTENCQLPTANSSSLS